MDNIDNIVNKYIEESDNTDMAVMDKKMTGHSPDRTDRIRRKRNKTDDDDSEKSAPK